MGFYATTFEPKTALRENLSSSEKSAPREIFPSNRKCTYQIERNPLETQQEKVSYFYETASGRSSWLGRDPIGEDGGVNLYAFARNNVVNQIDYLGLWVKVEGTDHTWCADSEFDTLHALAESYGDKDSWSCLWPVDGTEDSGAYDWGVVQVGDKYDASNLATPCPGATTLMLLADPSLSHYNTIFPGIVALNGQNVFDKIKATSGEGGTPISKFVLAGHCGGSIGGFSSHEFAGHGIVPSFSRAKLKKGPPRCWFSRDAKTRMTGCSTAIVAEGLADLVLRKGATSLGTNQSISISMLRMPDPNSPTGITPVGVPIMSWDLDADNPTTGDYWTSPVWQTYNGKL